MPAFRLQGRASAWSQSFGMWRMFSQTPLKVPGREMETERPTGEAPERDCCGGCAPPPPVSFPEVGPRLQAPWPGSCHRSSHDPESSGVSLLRGDHRAIRQRARPRGFPGFSPREPLRAPAGEARPFAPLRTEGGQHPSSSRRPLLGRQSTSHVAGQRTPLRLSRRPESGTTSDCVVSSLLSGHQRNSSDRVPPAGPPGGVSETAGRKLCTPRGDPRLGGGARGSPRQGLWSWGGSFGERESEEHTSTRATLSPVTRAAPGGQGTGSCSGPACEEGPRGLRPPSESEGSEGHVPSEDAHVSLASGAAQTGRGPSGATERAPSSRVILHTGGLTGPGERRGAGIALRR